MVRVYPYDVAPNVDTTGDGVADEGSLRGSSEAVSYTHLDVYKRQLLNPTAEFKGGTGKHKVEGKEEAKAARNNMLKRYMDLLLPQKKMFAYAILSSVILTLIGIVSTCLFYTSRCV